jgi:hypothetical protein
VWRTWERREEYTGLWWENTRKRNHLEDIGVDGRIILKGYEKNRMGHRLVLSGSGRRKAAGRGNEPWVTIQFWEFID